MKYVDVEELLKAQFHAEEYNQTTGDWDLPVVAVVDIEAMPAADVAPVVRARWIERSGYCGVVIVCSACGNGIFRGYSVFRPDGILYTDESASPPYCPHCGAKMNVELP